jgi:UDP-N-acetylglucosamine 2-epimerase (non-hydrolysing)
MKIFIVVGARPNFMKAAPILSAVRRHNLALEQTRTGSNFPLERLDCVLVHTGQHYDAVMSEQFFKELGLPQPDFQLGVGSGSHSIQTAQIMSRFEEVMMRERPDMVLVIGDVNSTLACALVVAKASFDGAGSRPLLGHVESGLRSFDRSMPEEINRVLTDRLADLLFVTEESGMRNLLREGISAEKMYFVGNTMIDCMMAFGDRAEKSTILDRLNLLNPVDGRPVPYALLTMHRPANVDRPESFIPIVDGLHELMMQYPVIFPAHPRTRRRVQEFGLEERFNQALNGDAPRRRTPPSTGTITMTEPLGYYDFLCLMRNTSLVVTDSGGIQEETTCLGVPCVTARENTERPVTVSHGTNTIAGVSAQGIREAIRRQLQTSFSPRVPEKWDGKAGERIVEILARHAAKSAVRDLNIVQTAAS